MVTASRGFMHLDALGPVKLQFLINTGCTDNMLLKATFDCLPAAIKEKLKPWDTTVMVADGNGILAYG